MSTLTKRPNKQYISARDSFGSLHPIEPPGRASAEGLFLSDDTTSGLTYGALKALVVAGVEPWASVNIAKLGANHDWVYNHDYYIPGMRGVQADIQQFNVTRSDLLKFEGAVDLFRLYEKRRDAGAEIDFKRDPVGSAEIVNAIQADSGINNELVWSFFQNLDRVTRQNGAVQYMRPSLTKAMGDLPNLGKTLAVIAAVGIGAFLLFEGRK